MENLSCKIEEVQLPLDLGKHEERVGITPQKTVEEGGEENPSVLKEKNRGGHQNIVARRNKEEGKKISPPNVKLPPKRPFGFPERYKSPTDSIMSPATRGLLARNKKYMRPMELPTYVPPKGMLHPNTESTLYMTRMSNNLVVSYDTDCSQVRPGPTQHDLYLTKKDSTQSK